MTSLIDLGFCSISFLPGKPCLQTLLAMKTWLCASHGTIWVIQRRELQILSHCASKDTDLEVCFQRAVLTILWSKIENFRRWEEIWTFCQWQLRVRCPHDGNLYVVDDDSKFLISYKANSIFSSSLLLQYQLHPFTSSFFLLLPSPKYS